VCVFLIDAHALQVEFTASERIGAMVRGMRIELDKLLDAKISDPQLDVTKAKVVAAAQELLSTDGF
jgi:ATP-dependent RNA helicase DHX57